MGVVAGATRGTFYRLRRVGYGVYHRLARWNYDGERFARPKHTVGGTIRTYDPLNVHGRDDLLARLVDECDADDVVVDAGANVGVYALALATDPGCRVAAFEPAPDTFERLRKNLAANDFPGTVSTHPVGLSDADGTATFHRSVYPELSSFNRYNASRWEAERQSTVEVPVRRLDGLVEDGDLPPPDHLKVDVEGHAFELLSSARRTLEEHRPTVYVELHPVADGRDRGDALRTLFDDCDYAVEASGRRWICHPVERI